MDENMQKFPISKIAAASVLLAINIYKVKKVIKGDKSSKNDAKNK